MWPGTLDTCICLHIAFNISCKWNAVHLNWIFLSGDHIESALRRYSEYDNELIFGTKTFHIILMLLLRWFNNRIPVETD